MENNIKYYKPNLSELYIGYECETQVDPYPDYVNTVIEDDNCFNFIINNDWRVRTKYLDSDDIISLGFKLLKNNVYSIMDEEHELFLQVDYNYENIDVIVSLFYYVDSIADYRFCGKCKSKNELKKILEWIR